MQFFSLWRGGYFYLLCSTSRARGPVTGLTLGGFLSLALVVRQVLDGLRERQQHLTLHGSSLSSSTTRSAARKPRSSDKPDTTTQQREDLQRAFLCANSDFWHFGNPWKCFLLFWKTLLSGGNLAAPKPQLFRNWKHFIFQIVKHWCDVDKLFFILFIDEIFANPSDKYEWQNKKWNMEIQGLCPIKSSWQHHKPCSHLPRYNNLKPRFWLSIKKMFFKC